MRCHIKLQKNNNSLEYNRKENAFENDIVVICDG